jgi:hypothetical protein
MHLATPRLTKEGARWYAAAVVPLTAGESLEFYTSNGADPASGGAYKEDRPSGSGTAGSNPVHNHKGPSSNGSNIQLPLYKLPTVGE